MEKIFINEFGRLRSGWRVLLYALALVASSLLVVTVLRVAYFFALALASQRRSNFLLDIVDRSSMLAAALIAGYVCVRFLEGLPWRSLGLSLHRGWLRDLIVGSAIGFVTLAVAVGIAAIGGGLQFSFNDAPVAAIARSMIGSGSLLFVAALAEEAMFRGYGLQTLTRAKLAWLGLLLTSVPFGLVHLWNPNVVPGTSFANTTLAGVWLGLAYLRTRSLWLPLGVHWAWNWSLGWFFGLPISGLKIVSNPLVTATDSGPEWLTGGSYGIEGGFACLIALVISCVFLWLTPWPQATPEMKKLTSEENPAVPSPVLTIRPADESA